MSDQVEAAGQPQPGRGLFDGYEEYRTPTETEYRAALTNGLVVVDTNVLLNLYRYTVQARTDFLNVLRALERNLWVPAQVIEEFWTNRESVLRNPRRAVETLKQLDVQRDNAVTQINQWAKLASLSSGDIAELTKTLHVAFDAVEEVIEDNEDSQNSLFAQDTNCDPLLSELEQILTGKVGPPFGSAEWDTIVEEGKRRIQADVAPGFCDVKAKGLDGAVGDFLVWEQILREASKVHRDVLLVTSEAKSDWWRSTRGELRGPHPHLIAELRDRAGVRLFMLQPDRLLEFANAVFQVSVHEGSSASVARVSSSLADEESLPVGGWNKEAMQELLCRLDQEAPVQASAIRQAATQSGYISRDDVFALGHYEPNRQLKGFTRPVKRIAQELREQGLVPEEAVDVLGTEYDHTNFGWASGFTMPQELIQLLT